MINLTFIPTSLVLALVLQVNIPHPEANWGASNKHTENLTLKEFKDFSSCAPGSGEEDQKYI